MFFGSFGAMDRKYMLASLSDTTSIWREGIAGENFGRTRSTVQIGNAEDVDSAALGAGVNAGTDVLGVAGECGWDGHSDGSAGEMAAMRAENCMLKMEREVW
jgi:hypothetical protein